MNTYLGCPKCGFKLPPGAAARRCECGSPFHVFDEKPEPQCSLTCVVWPPKPLTPEELSALASSPEVPLFDREKLLADIRTAVADYMRSEGCSCCRGEDHPANAERIAKLLGVPSYPDGSGYNFAQFATKQ